MIGAPLWHIVAAGPAGGIPSAEFIAMGAVVVFLILRNFNIGFEQPIQSIDEPSEKKASTNEMGNRPLIIGDSLCFPPAWI